MKGKINLICSILALFCFVSMFVPVIALRYPASEYYARSGSSDFFFTGEYYLAKSYWAVTDYVFGAQSVVWRIILSLDQGLLILWALLSVRGEAGRSGLWIALANLAVVAVVLTRMMLGMWACNWPVLIAIAVDTVVAVAMAAIAK